MFKWIKENIILSLVILLLLGVAGVSIARTFTNNYHTSKDTSSQSTTSSKSEETSTEEETANEKNYRTAKLKLEHPYTEASEDEKNQVSASFDQAISAIKQSQHLSNVVGTIENHLSMSQSGMTQTLAMAILVNKYDYQASQLEVTVAESEDVVQFLIVLTKAGEDNCYFVGNFNTTVNQIQLKAYVGGNIGGTFG